MIKTDKYQKVKLVKILEILQQESDENKPLSTTELLNRLHAQGIGVLRKTLYEDIKVLQEMGYEIFSTREKENKYYILDRKFDNHELRILIDAVQSASFITEKKSAEFEKKIAALGGSFRVELLNRDMTAFGTNKHSNEDIFYNINTLDEAIIHHKQVSFVYNDLDFNGKMIARNDGKRYLVNPIATVFSDGNYYLICFSEKHPNIGNYRIDRMKDAREEEADVLDSKCLDGFDINRYRRQLFSMYVGAEKTVTLEFDKRLIDVIFDKFGEKTKINKIDEEKYSVQVQVQLSHMFYGWCCNFENLKITAPQKVVDEMKDHIEKIKKNYEGNINELC